MSDQGYELRQLLQKAVRPLRDAEDLARIQMPAYPTADRIRDIYEQIGDDVLNGKTTVPPLKQRLREAEAREERLREALRGLIVAVETIPVWLDPQHALFAAMERAGEALTDEKEANR